MYGIYQIPCCNLKHLSGKHIKWPNPYNIIWIVKLNEQVVIGNNKQKNVGDKKKQHGCYNFALYFCYSKSSLNFLTMRQASIHLVSNCCFFSLTVRRDSFFKCTLYCAGLVPFFSINFTQTFTYFFLISITFTKIPK